VAATDSSKVVGRSAGNALAPNWCRCGGQEADSASSSRSCDAVLLFYRPEPIDVEAGDRAVLWERMESAATTTNSRVCRRTVPRRNWERAIGNRRTLLAPAHQRLGQPQTTRTWQRPTAQTRSRPRVVLLQRLDSAASRDQGGCPAKGRRSCVARPPKAISGVP
jgi:hypothetical protein